MYKNYKKDSGIIKKNNINLIKINLNYHNYKNKNKQIIQIIQVKLKGFNCLIKDHWKYLLN